MLINKLIKLLLHRNSPYAGAFERSAELETRALAAAHHWLDAQVAVDELLRRAAMRPAA